MWPTLAILSLLALLATTLWWKRRYARLEHQLHLTRSESGALAQRQQQLQDEVQAQQQALINSMVEGVIILGADGRVRSINQSLQSLFSLTHDIRGQTLLEAFRLDRLHQSAARALAEGQVLNEEIDLHGLERRCLQMSAAALLDRSGRRQGLVLVFHDLTRLKQLENTRKEFVANVSHELRTPLAMIKGFAETLLSGAKDDPTVATRFLQTIERHADRLTYLIEDLLTISRLESGQIVMNIQPTALRPIAEEVLNDLLPRAQERGTRLENRLPDDLRIQGDADRLQQVLFNLVDNAIKYGRPRGRVEISAGTPAGGLVDVHVHDDGPGIPPEALARVFERFYRVDKARSRDQGGTGLGLAIVKHIVQFHGGEVRVASNPDQGTTFSFTLRVAWILPTEATAPTSAPR